MIMVGGSPMPRRALLTIPLLIFGIIAIPAMSATTSAETDLERRFTQTVRPFLAPSKIMLEAPGNAGVETRREFWIESIARIGERADDSLRRERSALRAKV